MGLESFVVDVMEGKRPGRSLLRGLSYLYHAGITLRNLAYDAKLFKSAKVAAPVISIGNIVAGGTGKTPLVRFLAEELSQDFRIAILTRGYRSEIEKTKEVVHLSGEESAERCGDEPYWLARELPQAAIWVGRNRSLSAELAIAAGAQVLILDDGMQYRQLKRDVEIVVMDGDDLFGKGFFLPRGFLRDTPNRLKEADLIVVNQAKCHQKAKEALLPFTKAPIVFVRMKLNADMKGHKVGIFCAIGKPERFLHAVRDSGAEVVATFFKPDHEPFLPEELSNFAKRSGADFLVCTEKDHVKLPRDFECKLPIMPCEGEWEMISGHEYWQAMLESIKLKVQHV